MKINVKRDQSESQSPVVTIDTKTCQYPHAIRSALELALSLDGYSKETIQEVFNLYSIAECESQVNSEPSSILTVQEFVKHFVEHNTLIRLWYKIPKGEEGLHREVIEGDKPMMEHQLINSEYKNYKVIGVTDILYHKSNYVEAVNLVIKE